MRQQTDTHYRTMLDKLHRLFVRASDDAKTHPGSDERPYRTDTGTAQFQALPSRPAKSMARAATAGLDDAPSTNVDAPDLKAMVEMCGPRLTHMIGLISAIRSKRRTAGSWISRRASTGCPGRNGAKAS